MVDPRFSDSSDREGEVSGPIVDLHHIRIPVTDARVSRDWYVRMLGFVSILDLEEEQGLVGIVLRHPRGFVVGLHQDPSRAAALQGFAVLGLTVPDRAALQAWSDQLDHLGQPHTPVEEGHLGWYMDLPDPDGILVRAHTGTIVDAEEA